MSKNVVRVAVSPRSPQGGLTCSVFRCDQWKRHKHIKSESCWSVLKIFFFKCKDMSVRRFDVCIADNLCPLNFGTASYTKLQSSMDFIFFFFPLLFVQMSTLLCFLFIRLFLLFFMCGWFHVTGKWLAKKGHLVHLRTHCKRKKKHNNSLIY